MASLLNRFLTRLSNPITSSIRSFSSASTLYYIVKPPPQLARDDTPDDVNRCGLLIDDEDDALYLTKSMPGLGMENVHVEINWSNRLFVKGNPGGYTTVLYLPPSCRREDGQFCMENGLLRIKVPKSQKPNGPTQQAQCEAEDSEEYKSGNAVLIVGYQLQDE